MAGPEMERVNPLEVPLLLGNVWELIKNQIDDQHVVFKCGRSLLVNPEYIRLIDVSQKLLILADGINYYKLHPSREALIDLKARF